MTRALLDTSVVVALGRGEAVELGRPGPDVAISAVTLCGLHHGVLVADDRHRAERLATLAWAERHFAILDVDREVAPHYGRLLASARRRRRRRLQPADALIAATAAAYRLPLITRDRDFEGLEGVEVVLV